MICLIQKSKYHILFYLIVTSPTLGATTIECRAESANIIANLKSSSSTSYSTEALELARRAATIMCSRQLDDAKKQTATAETTSNQTESEKDSKGFLGLTFGKKERNDGHRRLQKKAY